MRNVPIARADREKVHKEVRKDLEPVIKKYGSDVIKWALNKWVTTERKRASLLAAKEQAEQELAQLD